MADLPTIRSVMPWWFVGGAAAALAVALLLAPVANLVVAPVVLSGLVVSTVRDRRAGTDDTSRWQEAVVAFVMTPLLLGAVAMISQVRPLRTGAVDGRLLVGGAVGIAVGGAVFLAARAVGRSRRP